MDKFLETGWWFLYTGLELTGLFLVISFVIGVITSYVSPQRVQGLMERHGKGLRGNVLGAVLGGLMPFCSCSAIPMLVGMLKVGVPFRIVMSFLIASPLGVFNLVTISLFSALFGIRVAALYVATTFVLAILAGIVLDRLGLAQQIKKVIVSGVTEDQDDNTMIVEGATRWEHLKPRLRKSWGFTTDLYRRMLPYLLIGIVVGAFIHGYVPEDFFVKYAGRANIFAVPLAAAIGVPMYVRTETLIPISAALVEKGVTIGAVMALIIGGAGASIPELSLLWAIFKRKLFVVYVITIFAMATGIGLLFYILEGLHWLGPI